MSTRYIILTLIFYALFYPAYSDGSCTCEESFEEEQLTRSCNGDYQQFFSNTTMRTGNWTTCTSVNFQGNFVATSLQNDNQTIHVTQSIIVQGDFTINQQMGSLMNMVIDASVNTASLEVMGNLIVIGGETFIRLSNITVHGDVIVQKTAQLIISPTVEARVLGNVMNSGYLFIEGLGPDSPSPVTLSSVTSDPESTFTVSYVNMTIEGVLNTQNALFSINGLKTYIHTQTAEFNHLEVIAVDEDRGDNFTDFRIIPLSYANSSTWQSANVSASIDWSCNATLVTVVNAESTGVMVNFSTANVDNLSEEYCCIKGISHCDCEAMNGNVPPECEPPCILCPFITGGHIAGWIVGGIALAVIIITATVCLARDCIHGH